MVVAADCLVERKERMWQITESGRLLILSTFGIERWDDISEENEIQRWGVTITRSVSIERERERERFWSELIKEFCSLPNSFFSFPSELTKIPLRELTHAELTHAGVFWSFHLKMRKNFWVKSKIPNKKCLGRMIWTRGLVAYE